MTVIQCINGKVAVRPFYKPVETKKTAGGALTGIAQMTRLIEVEVVYGSAKVPTGKAWLSPKTNDHPQAKEVVDFAGQQVVMIDEGFFWAVG